MLILFVMRSCEEEEKFRRRKEGKIAISQLKEELKFQRVMQFINKTHAQQLIAATYANCMS
jgi:hypothetical protein